MNSLFSNPHLTSVAVLRSSALENAKVREMISRTFHDYHHLPVDTTRLLMAPGHVYGKAQEVSSISWL